MVNFIKIQPVSMITKDNRQRVNLYFDTAGAVHLTLSVLKDGVKRLENIPVALNGGKGSTHVLLPVQNEDFNAEFAFYDKKGNLVYKTECLWRKPVEWTLYAMISSHTDIGLHNSQYIQRFEACRFTDMAQRLCDETDSRSENDRYRYTMEGTWFFNCYMQHRDWIKKAQSTASSELSRALDFIASKIPSTEEKVVVFNSTLQQRCELLETKYGYKRITVPPFGYVTVPKNSFLPYKKNTVPHSAHR